MISQDKAAPSTADTRTQKQGTHVQLQTGGADAPQSRRTSEEEIAAMSDEDTVTALNAMWSNFCVTETYEPGSVVKPIVMAGALEKGKISETDTFVCDGGQTFGANGDTYIKCAVWPDAHGTEALRDVIANSCNDAMMQIAAKMGTEQFLKAQTLFNFGSRTGIDLPNEGYGIMHTVDTMHETELACLSLIHISEPTS